MESNLEFIKLYESLSKLNEAEYKQFSLFDNTEEENIIEEPMYTTWSDLYELRIKKVPKDIIDFAKEKAKEYAKNGFGYQDKDYGSYYAIQVDVNANADEATYLNLLNNDISFINTLNKLILDAHLVPKQKIISGHYDFNTNHNLTNHDLPQKMISEEKKTHVDILRNDKYNPKAIWSIEIKSSTSSARPKSVHHADLVLLHLLGTSNTVVYLPNISEIKDRNDSCYINIGTIQNFGDWKNIHIDKNGNITRW